jgi:predicted ATP-binding protein involved in virulence
MMTSRLTEFHVEGLFGLYSHKIQLNLKERITIIIGPNGRGKTVCLKFGARVSAAILCRSR